MKKVNILIWAFIVSACGGKEEVKEEVLRPVRYQEVFASGGVQTKTFSGSTKAGIETNLSFKVSGSVQTVNVKVGQPVKAGQLIASLDPSDYILQYEESDAAVKSADAEEKNAKSNFERLALLYENQNASLSEFEAARTQYASARANEKSAKQRRKLAESQLDYTKLRAPLDGVIARVEIEQNENVNTGELVVVLNSGSDIEVEVAVPGRYISRIKVGDQVTVIISSLGTKEYQATVTEVAFATVGLQTTFPVSIKLNQLDQQIRPGMAADVQFTFVFDEGEDKMMVPPVAVGEDGEGRFVYVIQETGEDNVGLVERKPVSVGDLTNDGLEITEGLEEGALVITAGVSKISDGMKVQIPQ